MNKGSYCLKNGAMTAKKKWEPGDVLVEKGEKDELFYLKKFFYLRI